MSWDPILDGEPAARARVVLPDVVNGLANEAAPSHEPALFWTYANASLDDVQTHVGAAMERFLAGLAPIEPLWDRLFLCDLEVAA